MKNARTCTYGHVYFKTSNCPTCPVCEKERNPKNEFPAALSAPAKRALENEGIKALQQLAGYSETEILKLHGMGPGSLPKLNNVLQAAGLSFKNKMTTWLNETRNGTTPAYRRCGSKK